MKPKKLIFQMLCNYYKEIPCKRKHDYRLICSGWPRTRPKQHIDQVIGLHLDHSKK